jgi:hypothetical protein
MVCTLFLILCAVALALKHSNGPEQTFSLGEFAHFQCALRAGGAFGSNKRKRPSSNCTGRGGQPRMWRSTGITFDTAPTTA